MYYYPMKDSIQFVTHESRKERKRTRTKANGFMNTIPEIGTRRYRRWSREPRHRWKSSRRLKLRRRRRRRSGG